MRRVKVLFDGASAQVGVVRLSSCRGTVLNERRQFEQYIYPDFTNGVVAKANAPIYGAAYRVLWAVFTGLRSSHWLAQFSPAYRSMLDEQNKRGTDPCIYPKADLRKR